MTRVKMCGLFRDEDISYANEVKPDYIGFVFYPKSHRYVSIEKAQSLKARLDPEIKAVGVFVDSDISFIKELVAKNIIDIVQLHGHEDSNYIHELRKSIDNPDISIIQAIVIKNEADILRLPQNDFIDNEFSADYYLVDSGMGSGSSFNWDLLKEHNGKIFLAGGLNTENIAKALSTVKPFAVDVSSGIETDRIKDFDKMKKFISLVKENRSERNE
ncbi:phosphoribosylanthranilate isomerase TrpF [Butyrivibrio proteoclasticus B316]|uniref:N-(5'-phosphoribosyl)anthranilate isomerase n=2 Tax=Butyrivibrio proteoclasticus TaxID=43305 RepID=E0S2D9_BUTPB|nr:phosphoribosylanthranilate isomerase TrpF [Butyrivibrio proteoclasticus B316]